MLSTPTGLEDPEALIEERPAGKEVECRLDADHPVNALAGDRQPCRVARDPQRGRLAEPVAAGRQLPFSNIHRDERTWAQDLGDDRILRAQAVPDVEYHADLRQCCRYGLHQPTACRLGLFLGTRTLPEAEVEPAGRRRKEEIGPDALVYPRGGIPALPEDSGNVPQMPACPSGRSGRVTISSSSVREAEPVSLAAGDLRP
jgi:hypothetical protein